MTFLLQRTGFFLKILCAVIIISSISSSYVFTQTTPKFTISGQVTNSITGEPIVNVNLFLANTTLGSKSGKDGKYLIRNIPSGMYELVVSHISYEFQNTEIKLLTPDSLVRNFSLTPRIINVGEVFVEAPEPKEWKKNLKTFTNLFLGESKNAKKCKIINPEVINFLKDPKIKNFSAISDSIIIIENRALGYRLHIILNSFVVNEKRGDLFYRIFTKFEFLEPKNNKEEKNWHKNRQNTYNGSFLHFLKSLINKNSFKSGYTITREYELGRYSRGKLIDPQRDQLITKHSSVQFDFHFRAYLHVQHKSGESWIRQNGIILIDSIGNYSPHDAIKKWGAWANERISDLLPKDYVPHDSPQFSTRTIPEIETTRKIIEKQEKYTQNQIDSIIKKRWNFRDIRSKYPKSAMEIIEVIKRCCPNEIDSMAATGMAKMEKQDWRTAISWFEMTLTKEPDNLLSHYGIGVCKRELGRASFIERIGFWPSSEKHFKLAIKIDSTYENLFYQYSLLESYRENDDKAITLIDKQLEIGEFDNQAKRQRLRLYDKLLHEKSPKETETWFKSRNTARDIYYLGELYRIDGQFEKADSIYQTLLSDDDDFPKVQVYLSLVRLYVQTDQPEKTEETYWQAVESVSSDLDKKLLFDDFIYIVKEKEYNTLDGDVPLHQLPDLYRIFWLERNPMPAAPYNFRLIEHYRRLIYAEKHFRYGNPRRIKSQSEPPVQSNQSPYVLSKIQYPKWYTENYKFNDEALIYIRFGEPDDKAFAFPKPASGKEGWNPRSTPGNMSWLYYESGDRPKMIFHFIVSDDQLSPGSIDSWRLTPGFFLPEIVDELLWWDSKYHNIDAFRDQIIDERTMDISYGLQNDSHSWPEGTKSLDMVHTLAQFRHSRVEDLLQFSYAIPLAKIFDEKTKKDSVFLEVGILIFDDKMVPLYKDIKNYTIKGQNDAHVWQHLFIDEFEFPLELKHYNIALHARIPDGARIDGFKYYHILSDSARDQLSCSSLKLAFDITSKSDSENRHRNNLKIIPNPTKQFKKVEPLFAYFEIYNLEIDSDGKTDYSLNFELTQVKEKKNVFNKVLGLFGEQEKYQVSVNNDYKGETQTATDFISFDISRLDKGEYELKMLVMDNVSSKKIETKADFVIN